MPLIDRIRGAARQASTYHGFSWFKLRNMPLSVKLMAAVLCLVIAALSLISIGSTLFLRSYFVGQIDSQLKDFSDSFNKAALFTELRDIDLGVLPPSGFYVRTTTIDGAGGSQVFDGRSLAAADLPPVVKGVTEVSAREGKPYVDKSLNGKYRWRMLVTVLNNGSVLQVGQQLSSMEGAIARLIYVDILVGSGVLLALAAIGAAIVRQSLVPLVQIERTAGAIAAGDLSRRVPDPEPGSAEPYTELGRLSRALNAMLAQIEAAFTARATSETVARAAESAARDAAEAAKSSEARAVRSEEKMRQFVADASHELRTPLTTIRGFAELYRQGAVTEPEDIARVVRRIEDEAARMGLLVEDLLLLARLDRERPIVFAPVELPVLALDAVQAAQAVAPGRVIELEIQDAPDRLVAYGDDARLRQIIGNLMTNALTHTPASASVTLRLHADAGNVAVVDVADTGPGLTPDRRERVFERFYRADEARTRRTDRAATGTGLGLAIVAAIVGAHNGTVEVLETPGGGATFRVRLPLVPQAATPMSAAATTTDVHGVR